MTVSKRRIVVGENTYSWFVGRDSIEIRKLHPDGKSSTFACPSIAEVMDMTPSDVERGLWKRTLAITPKAIEKFIREEWERIRSA